MPGKQRYTQDQVVVALKECNGLLYLAAQRLGCDPDTVTNYLNRYPRLRRIVQEHRGRRVDLAEAALDRAVLAGEAWAVQFLLRTQAKDRGYIEKSIVEVEESEVEEPAREVIVRTREEAQAVLCHLGEAGRLPGRP